MWHIISSMKTRLHVMTLPFYQNNYEIARHASHHQPFKSQDIHFLVSAPGARCPVVRCAVVARNASSFLDAAEATIKENMLHQNCHRILPERLKRNTVHSSLWVKFVDGAAFLTIIQRSEQLAFLIPTLRTPSLIRVAISTSHRSCPSSPWPILPVDEGPWESPSLQSESFLQIVRQEGRLIEGCTVVRLKSSENWKNFLNMPGCRQKENLKPDRRQSKYPCGLRPGHAQQHEVSAAVAELPEKRLGLTVLTSHLQTRQFVFTCFNMRVVEDVITYMARRS